MLEDMGITVSMSSVGHLFYNKGISVHSIVRQQHKGHYTRTRTTDVKNIPAVIISIFIEKNLIYTRYICTISYLAPCSCSHFISIEIFDTNRHVITVEIFDTNRHVISVEIFDTNRHVITVEIFDSNSILP